MNRRRNTGNAGDWGNVMFREMSSNIPRNVLKRFFYIIMTYIKTKNISGNPQTFRGILPNFTVHDLSLK